MSTIASVENGTIIDTTTISTSSSSSSLDKDAFLQLLVAQMQYQDPLEPTSNTEFISQYAQFSQVEALNNMADTSELARATSLIGHTVYITTTSSTGMQTTIAGIVDYVVYEDGKALLSVNDSLYSLDDVETVVDPVYIDAINKAYNFVVDLNKLPTVAAVDESNIEELEALKEIYEGMSVYEKTFIATEVVEMYDSYMEKLEELYASMESTDEEDSTDVETDVETDLDVETEVDVNTDETEGESDETTE